MKAILEFDLNLPEERDAHLRCVKSADMSQALWDISHNLRKELENKYDMMPEKEYAEKRPGEVLGEIFDGIFNVIEDNNINLNELIS